MSIKSDKWIRRMAEKNGMIEPFEPGQIREQADSGKPTVVSDPDGPVAATYRQIARKIAARIAKQAEDRSGVFPKIVIQNN